MKIVFVAGPFRADTPWAVEQHIRRAEELALEVWRLGAAALCPHTNTRFFNGAAPDAVWLNGYIAMLRRCDALITTDDWERSAGATAEVVEARISMIPVFHHIGDLRIWLEQS